MNNTLFRTTSKTGDLNADWIMRQYMLDKMAKFMEIKSINPKIKQSEKARELAISTSTLQRQRRETKMRSPHRILQSQNTNTRKEKTSIHTEHDLKTTSDSFKMTSNDLKLTSNEAVENKKIELKGGDQNNVTTTRGCILIEQYCSSN